MGEEVTTDLSSDETLRLILSRLDAVDARLAAREAKSYDTRPIWERALAEMQEVRQQLNEVHDGLDRMESKFDVRREELLDMKGFQKRLDRRVTKLEGDQA